MKSGVSIRTNADIIDYNKRCGFQEGIEKGIEEGFEQGIKQGIEKGIEQGKKENSIELAKKLLNKIDIDEIAQITGLSIDELDNL